MACSHVRICKHTSTSGVFSHWTCNSLICRGWLPRYFRLCLPNAEFLTLVWQHATKWTISLVPDYNYLSKLFFETGSHYVILAGLKHYVDLASFKLKRSACPCLPAGIKGVCYRTQLSTVENPWIFVKTENLEIAQHPWGREDLYTF